MKRKPDVAKLGFGMKLPPRNLRNKVICDALWYIHHYPSHTTTVFLFPFAPSTTAQFFLFLLAVIIAFLLYSLYLPHILYLAMFLSLNGGNGGGVREFWQLGFLFWEVLLVFAMELRRGWKENRCLTLFFFTKISFFANVVKLLTKSK